MASMLRLVGLIRVSTEKQAGENGEGLERQRTAIRDIAKTRKAAELRLVELPGVHGYSVADTREWSEVVVLLRQGWHLALDSIDRLLRAEDFDFRVYQDVKAAGAVIYTPAGVQDLGEPQGALLATILGAFGGYNRHALLRQMKMGRIAARKAGKWASGAHTFPTGVLHDERNGWSIEPAGAARVRQAFEAIAAGKTLLATAKALGCHPPTIVRWIKNPIYRGVLRATFGSMDLGKGEIRVFPEGESVVSESVWRTANARMQESQALRRKRRNEAAPGIWASSFLYSAYEVPGVDPQGGVQKLDMDAAPRHVVYGRTDTKQATTYICRCQYPSPTWTNKPAKCGLQPLRADRVNAALDRYLTDLTRSEDVLDAMRAALSDPPPDTTADKARIEKALAELDRREARLVDLHLDAGVSRAVFDAKRQQIERDRYALKTELAFLESPKGPTTADVDALLATWVWDSSWSPTRKREWLAKYAPGGIRVGKEGVYSVRIRIPTESGNGVTVKVRMTDVEGDIDIAAAGTKPAATFPGEVGRTWRGLIKISALASVRDARSHRIPAGTLTTREVALALGVAHSSFQHDVAHGVVPRPALLVGRTYCWTPAEAEAARAALAASR